MINCYCKRPCAFTLIELIMVIVILGILSAAAIPRFIDFGDSARTAAVKSMAGAVRSATGIVHSTALAMSQSAGTITIESRSVNIVNGYPEASADGLGVMIVDVSEFTVDYATANTAIYAPASAIDNANCRVTYVEGLPPTITDVTGSC